MLSGYEFLDYEQIANAGMAYQLGIHALSMVLRLAVCGAIKALFARWMRDILRAAGTYIGSDCAATVVPAGAAGIARGTHLDLHPVASQSCSPVL